MNYSNRRRVSCAPRRAPLRAVVRLGGYPHCVPHPAPRLEAGFLAAAGLGVIMYTLVACRSSPQADDYRRPRSAGALIVGDVFSISLIVGMVAGGLAGIFSSVGLRSLARRGADVLGVVFFEARLAILAGTSSSPFPRGGLR